MFLQNVFVILARLISELYSDPIGAGDGCESPLAIFFTLFKYIAIQRQFYKTSNKNVLLNSELRFSKSISKSRKFRNI